MADQAVVKVKFKQPFYGPVVGDPKTMILYKKVEDLLLATMVSIRSQRIIHFRRLTSRSLKERLRS
jgi:hypothetical protein